MLSSPISGSTEETLNNGTFCNLRVSIWTASKKVPTGEVELGETDEALFRVNKDLIEKSVLKPIRQQAQKAAEILHNRALPFNIRGVYYIPTKNISTVMESIAGYQSTFYDKVEEFCSHYHAHREEAHLRLNGHFVETDYPSADKIRDKFKWELQLMQFSAPSRLQFVSKEMYDQAMMNFHADIETFRENSIGLLREKFKGLVDHIVERLTPDEDGQRKIFRNSMVDNLKSFVQDFQHLNITNDTELAEEINKVNLLMEGVQPQELRSSGALPQQLSSILSQVQENVDQMIISAPKRRVRYEASSDNGVAA
jgi:hypothetical protein